MLAQVLGAMAAAAVVYGNYKSAFDAFEGGAGIRTVSGPTATAGIFCTYPAEFMSKTGQFFSEFIASTLLMFLIYALKDDGNIGAGNLTPLGLFFIIFGIGCAWGWETGYAINLARDFGPRLVSYMIGYGHGVWVSECCICGKQTLTCISLLVATTFGYLWWRRSLDAPLVDGSTMCSCTPERVRSTHRGWA